MAFPTTGILDNFDRADEGPPPSASWAATGVGDAVSGGSVTSTVLALTGGYDGGGVWGTAVGPDCENYITVSTIFGGGNSIYCWLRLKDTGIVTFDGYAGRMTRIDANPGGRFVIFRLDDGGFTQLGATVNETGGVLADGVKFGADVVGDVITTYINRSGTWDPQATFTGDTTYTVSGSIAVSSDSGVARFDDFGGGTAVAAVVSDLLGQFPTQLLGYGAC